MIFSSIGYDVLTADKDTHWAFRPVVRPAIPDLASDHWSQNPIDRFILQKLQANGLPPSPPADRRTLLRRLALTLTGLMPSEAEVRDFETAPDTKAFTQIMDRILADASYGKRWARHWLDVARYADAKGYVDAGEATFPFAYTYRDYVVRAFNQDLPFSDFIVQQIAADKTIKERQDPATLAALGFLTVGSRFNFFPHEIMDDRIDVVTRGFLGLTVACARCHDHKFDPIGMRDYYALYGIFQNSEEPTLDQVPRIDTQSQHPNPAPANEPKLQEAADKYRALRREQHQRVMYEMRAWAGDYLRYIVQTTPKHRTKDQPDLVTARGMIREVSAYAGGAVRHWRRYLENQTEEDPVFGLWHRLFQLKREDIPLRFPDLFRLVSTDPEANRAVIAAFEHQIPQNMEDVASIYGALLESVDQAWREALKTDPKATHLEPPEAEQIRQSLYGPESPASIREDEAIDYLTLDESVAIRKHFADIERVFLEHWSDAVPRPMMLQDRARPVVAHVFRRGDPEHPTAIAPRSVPGVLGLGEDLPIPEGSGRLQLAQAIAHPKNPLTARVLVNRVWAWHFGSPLVGTPSDFGTRSEPPVHADLLDYLASYFWENGGSIKALHRLILNSATWQQASTDRADGRRMDPDNRLFWHMPHRRLAFETVRDTMLQAAGHLIDPDGGPPVRQAPDHPENHTRTLYCYVDREDLADLFRVFDFPSPDISAAHRTETTVPQQSLFLLNSPFVLEQARAMVASLPSGQDPQEALSVDHLKDLFGRLYQRTPTAWEIDALQAYSRQRRTEENASCEAVWIEIVQSLLLSNEFQFLH